MMLMRSVSPKPLRFAAYRCLVLCLAFPLSVTAETPNAKDVADLRELQLEVRSLRDDVRRLSELLGKQFTHQPSDSSDAGQAESANSLAANMNAPAADIKKSLLQPISISFTDKRLRDVIGEIRKLINVNIVIDEGALADEGIQLKDLVSVEVNGVSAGSALKSILEPLNLTFLVEKDLLKITNTIRAKGPLVNEHYSVEDLIGRLVKEESQRTGQVEQSVNDSKRFLLEIRTLITKTVSPDSWEEAGGRGSLRLFEPTCSVVINQTHDVHEEVSQLLQQLRRVKRLPPAIHQTSDSERVVLNYAVADLVVPFAEPLKPRSQVTPSDWLKLVDRIRSEIEPGNWSSNGGSAVIQVHQPTLSLVINATPSMHESIAEMFSEMRRGQLLQLTFATTFFPALSEAELEESGLKLELDSRKGMTRVTREEARQLEDLAIKVGREKILYAPKVTTWNGVMASIGSNIKGEDPNQPRIELHLRGHISDDRRSVRLSVALNPESLVNDLLANSYQLKDGDYLLLDLTDRQLTQQNPPKLDKEMEAKRGQDASGLPTPEVSKSRVFVLVQPRIVVQEEEEELLDPSSKNAKPK